MAAEPVEKDEMSAIFFSNLQLLGMDIIDMEGIYKIQFNKNMFNLPNKLGSEVVLHFLFQRLNPILSREQFRDCWPVIDRKTELQFRKVCSNWLLNIQKETTESHLPHVSTALLLSPGGRKFIHLVYSFSTYVLMQVMKSEHGWKSQYAMNYPTIQQSSNALGCLSSSAIQDSIVRESEGFFKQLHVTVVANRQLKDFINEMVKEFRGLTKSIRELELEKREQVNVLTETSNKQGLSLPAKRTLTMFDSDHDPFAIKQSQRIEKAKSQWKSLTKLNDDMAEEREILQSILSNTAAKYIIDGTELGIRVPGLLLRECSKEIQKRQIDNVYNGGALNLVSLVQLWNICLNMYKEQLKSETLPSVASEVPHITAQAHKHHSHLRHTQELRDKMSKHTLHKLRNSIDKLQEKLNNQREPASTTDKNINRLGLNLTAPTPPMMAVNRNPHCVEESPPGPMAGMITHSESTPDALENIDKAIQRCAEASNAIRDVSYLSRFLKSRQRSVSKTGTSVPVSKSRPKGSTLKPSEKSLESSKVLTAKGSVEAGPGRSIQPDATGKYQNKVKPAVTFNSFTTPRTSKQKAEDILADDIVNSVLNPTETTLLNFEPLFEFGELGAEAFESRNLIERSPLENSKTFHHLESSKTPGGARPKTLSADRRSNSSSDSQKKRSPEASIHSESVFSQNSKDADSSFDSGESDYSNNATLSDINLFLQGKVKQSSSESLYKTDTQTNVSNLLFKTPEAIHGSISSQMFNSDTALSAVKTPESSKKGLDEESKNFLSESLNNNWDVFSFIETLNKPSFTHENGTVQTSPRPNASTSFLNKEFYLPKGRVTLETSDSTDFTGTPQNSSCDSQSNLSQNKSISRKTFDNITPDMNRNSILLPHVSDRQPGDGQASSNQTLQPVIQKDKDSNTKPEATGTDLKSLSPITLDHLSLSTSNLTPTFNRLRHDNNLCGENVSNNYNSPQTQIVTDSLTTDTQLQPNKTSEYLSYLHKKSLTFESASPGIIDISNAQEILSSESKGCPSLVSLSTEDEESDSEQAISDTFVPSKQGIYLDSRSPCKLSLTPAKVTTPLISDDVRLSPNRAVQITTLSTEESLKVKLALLQKKTFDILDNSSEDCAVVEDTSLVRPIKTTENQGSNGTDKLNATDDAKDDDILNTELINTDLLDGFEDLISS